jgi:thiamine pyrophosphate-dependent acetolactate synthase large subunit-like protein
MVPSVSAVDIETEEQVNTFDDVEGTIIPRTQFDLVAEAVGVQGYWVEDPETLQTILAEPHKRVRVVCVNTETAFLPVRYPPGLYGRSRS